MGRSFLKPWLYLPAEWTHAASQPLLYSRKWISKKKQYLWAPVSWKNIEFKNPLGCAGGLDKSGRLVEGWWSCGPGFVEIGTITPKPQKPNKGKILAKNTSHQALWNYMGFPNKGVDFVLNQLQKLQKPYFTPIFASIGKNRNTPLEKAHMDYNTLIQKLEPYVSGLIINISSPNTQHLRGLFEGDFLKNFLDSIKMPKTTPMLLKISPDLSNKDFLRVIQTSMDKNIDGWVLCNSTLSRNKSCEFPTYGGVSGRPLAPRSKELLKLLVQYLGSQQKEKLIISSGGVLSSEDVFERLALGAHLVQVYTALVFHGWKFFQKTQLAFLKKSNT